MAKISQATDAAPGELTDLVPIARPGENVAYHLALEDLYPWQAFTPTWTNLTVGNGTVTARYTQVGKTVHFSILLVFGSTTSVSGAIIVSLPAAVQSSAAATISSGRAVMRDNDTTNRYDGLLQIVSSTTAQVWTSGSPMASSSATAPFTWAQSDQLYITGTYEAA